MESASTTGMPSHTTRPYKIYDWKRYYLGTDLNDNDESSGVDSGSDSDIEIDPQTGGGGSADILEVQDPNEVILSSETKMRATLMKMTAFMAKRRQNWTRRPKWTRGLRP
jgi:hypothetical protein